MSDTLRVVVDDVAAAPKVKGALPLPGLADVPRKVIALGTEAVAGGVAAALSSVYKVLDALPEEPAGHEVTSVKFSLVVDATGEVSLFSAVKGGVAGHSGLEFTITRARKPVG